MNAQYDANADAVSIRLTEAVIEESEELRPGLIVDLDADGRIVGFEILDARDVLSKGTDLRAIFDDARPDDASGNA